MAFNGTGTFVRLYNWVTDKGNSIPITASRMDAEMDGMATGLSNCITKDGQTIVTDNIPMYSNKFTGLATGNARTDSISLNQVQDNQFLDAGTTGGSADAYTITLSPVITAYASTMRFTAKIHAVNTTTTPYIQFNSIATPASNAVVKKLDLSGNEIAVEASDLLGVHEFKRNSANDAWIVLDPKKPYFNSNNITYSGLIFRNVLINGAMAVDQRNAGAARTITAAAALAYTVDRWYAYCTGANVTGQKVAGTAPNQSNYRFTGAASVTKIGFAQRIEAAESQHLAGNTAVLSVDLANSLLTTVTWTAWYANSSDTFGTLASPTRTQIATGTFTVSSTLTRFSTSISIPSAATTGIEIEFSVGAQTSGTFTIGRAQLELGSVATTFDYRSITQEILQCRRYARTIGAGLPAQVYATNTGVTYKMNFEHPMRVSPSITLTTQPNIEVPGNYTSVAVGATLVSSNLSANGFVVSYNGFASVTNKDSGHSTYDFALLSSEL